MAKRTELRKIAANKAAVAKSLTDQALERMVAEGLEINFVTVAKEAGVSRRYLYSNPYFRNLIMSCRTTAMSKADLRAEVTRLRIRNSQLEQAIEQMDTQEPNLLWSSNDHEHN